MNYPKPPSIDGLDFTLPERLKGSGRKGGGQPDSCRRCGTLLKGEDPDPLRDWVIVIEAPRSSCWGALRAYYKSVSIALLGRCAYVVLRGNRS